MLPYQILLTIWAGHIAAMAILIVWFVKKQYPKDE